MLLTTADAKGALKIPAASSADDTAVGEVLAAAQAQVEKVTGPLAPTMVTDDVVVSWNGSTALTTTPVLSLATVASVPAGSTVDVSTLTVTAAGVLTGLPPGLWRVTYQAGWVTVPAEIREAVIEELTRLWNNRRGPGRRVGGPDSEVVMAGTSERVEALLEGYDTAGFA